MPSPFAAHHRIPIRGARWHLDGSSPGPRGSGLCFVAWHAFASWSCRGPRDLTRMLDALSRHRVNPGPRDPTRVFSVCGTRLCAIELPWAALPGLETRRAYAPWLTLGRVFFACVVVAWHAFASWSYRGPRDLTRMLDALSRHRVNPGPRDPTRMFYCGTRFCAIELSWAALPGLETRRAYAPWLTLGRVFL